MGTKRRIPVHPGGCPTQSAAAFRRTVIEFPDTTGQRRVWTLARRRPMPSAAGPLNYPRLP